MRLADLRPNFSTLDKTARLNAVSEYRAKRLQTLTHIELLTKKSSKAKKETDSSQTITAAEKALLKKLGLSLKGIKNLGD